MVTYCRPDEAINAAKRAARQSKQTLFIVREDIGQWVIATEYDLDTFFNGCTPDYAVEPDGTVTK